jgi:hypothetical protein
MGGDGGTGLYRRALSRTVALFSPLTTSSEIGASITHAVSCDGLAAG